MYECRIAVPDDAAAVARIHDASRRSAYRGLLTDDQLNAMTLDERTEFWRQIIVLGDQKDMRVFVLVASDGLISGFISLKVQRGKNRGELDRIYVYPDESRKRRGSALIKCGLDYLRDYGFQKATLWTFEANSSARQFYDAMGFKPDGAERKWSGMPKELRYAIVIEPR